MNVDLTKTDGNSKPSASTPAVEPLVIMVDSASSVQVPIAPSLDRAVQDLSQDQNSLRIRKLLIYACTHTWESDPVRVLQADLGALVQHLIALTLHPEQLSAYLNQVASTLNKSADYLPIADTICQHINSLYPADTLPSYDRLAQTLSADPEHLRIKKLLVLAVQSRWISDNQELAALSMTDLLRELHQAAPTLESLAARLTSRVKKLSKPAAYILISGKIIEGLKDLYPTPTPDRLPAAPETTELMSQSVSEFVAPKPPPVPVTPSPQTLVRTLPSTADLSDLFDMRAEILRRTNPFQAKILLFSLLHEPFQPTVEHYLLLKGLELDELLRMTLQTNRILEHLDLQLTTIAKTLRDSNYTQVAQTILQAVQLLYLDVSEESQFYADRAAQSTRLVKPSNMGETTQTEYHSASANPFPANQPDEAV